MHTEGGKVAAFQKLLKEFQLTKGEVLVIGDNPDSEIAAAKRLGILTAFINRSGKYPEALKDFEEVVDHFFR